MCKYALHILTIALPPPQPWKGDTRDAESSGRGEDGEEIIDNLEWIK